MLSVGKKRSTSSTTKKTAPIETGTNNPNNVDYDWLPKQTLASLSKLYLLLNNLIHYYTQDLKPEGNIPFRIFDYSQNTKYSNVLNKEHW